MLPFISNDSFVPCSNFPIKQPLFCLVIRSAHEATHPHCLSQICVFLTSGRVHGAKPLTR